MPAGAAGEAEYGGNTMSEILTRQQKVDWKNCIGIDCEKCSCWRGGKCIVTINEKGEKGNEVDGCNRNTERI